MIILHAGELEDSLAIWAEVSEYSRTRPAAREMEDSIGVPYISAAGATELAGAMTTAAASSKPPGRPCKILAWLPTRTGDPVPSSRIVDSPPPPEETSASAWIVAARHLRASEIPALLRGARNRVVAPGVIAGADLTYWSDLLLLAGSLVARQRFLPDVIREEKQYKAVWSPVIMGADVIRFNALANRMPSACRAITGPFETSPPAGNPSSVLGSVLTTMTDYMVRSSAAGALPEDVRKGTYLESTHDTWLYALQSQRGVMRGGSESASNLGAQVSEWQRPVSAATSAPYHLCFRLEEPVEGSRGPWNVRYLLQSRDDPSLLVPADEFWEREKSNGAGPKMREILLTSLGQASMVSPGIAAGLEESGLEGFPTNTAGAYAFLTEEAGALEQAGYTVMLPAWWTGKGKNRILAKANVKNAWSQGGTGITMGSMIRFDWEVALGDKNVTLEELDKLADSKSGLVNLRGQWVEAGTKEIRSAIKFLKRGQQDVTLRDMVMMGVGGSGVPKEMDLEVSSEQESVLGLLERLRGKAKMEELEQPEGFTGTLRPYQTRGYSWLSFLQQSGMGGCLADDMGLGKTIEMLAMIQKYRKEGGSSPTLLVCPMSVIENWRKEMERFTPELDALIHHGPDRSSGKDLAEQAAERAVVITSYGLLHRDVESLARIKWGGIVLDEAQNVKNPETKQSKAARTLKGDFKFALTGTPVENNVGDLWSIMDFLNPGLLGTRNSFVDNFFMPIQVERDRVASERLKRITGPFILRRLKTDRSIISDLPEKMEMKVYCTLTKEQASLYASVVKQTERALAEAQGIQRRGIILATLSKLKQICNHPAHFLGDNSVIPGRSGKIARMTEMLTEAIEAGDRCLIFSQFVEMGHIIRQHVQETFGLEVPFLHGGVSKEHRDRMVERFQDGGSGPQVFMLSLKAGGTGLNLTAASRVFHFDRWWNPAVENQATDRAFRIGQTQNVQVHKLVCAGTLEEKIDEMIERKKEVSDEVVGTGEGWLTELSNEDLRDVLALNIGTAVM